MSDGLKVAYIFTTFPARSETFFQREQDILAKLPLEISISSLWGGGNSSKYKVNTFNKWVLCKTPFIALKLLYCSPKTAFRIIKLFLTRKPKSFENLGENLIGLGFALTHAREIKKRGFDLLHGTWATTPGAAVLFLNYLTKIPYTLEGHAYDLFENGGDMFLKEKITGAQQIRTSSELAKTEFIKHGADPKKITLIRHPLTPVPIFQKTKTYSSCLKIISIGRLIEKKGFLRQLEIYAYLLKNNFSFEAKIIGDGPQRKLLEEQIKKLKLENHVKITGWLAYEEIEKEHEWADVHLFTGKIARSGDRDGLPTVVTESMAKGVINISSAGGAVPEAILQNETGLLVHNYENNQAWLDALNAVRSDKFNNQMLRKNARDWFEQNCSPDRNMQQMFEILKASAN